jgi:hypothetical protein
MFEIANRRSESDECSVTVRDKLARWEAMRLKRVGCQAVGILPELPIASTVRKSESWVGRKEAAVNRSTEGSLVS